MKKIGRLCAWVIGSVAALYLLLLIPDAEPSGANIPSVKPFEWRQDALWDSLANDFKAAERTDTFILSQQLYHRFQQETAWLKAIADTAITASQPVYDSALFTFFKMAPLVAALPQYRDAYLQLYNQSRYLIKQQSIRWNPNDILVRNRLYKSLYGMRAAVEEVLLQTSAQPYNPVMLVNATASATPGVSVLGMEVHSGDMLVSRGGAAVSALIARGNDYPANFSHVAFIYVNQQGKAFVIEAHIEKGVAISTIDDYIKDKKLRCMVLRLRPNLPAMKMHPQLPQQAAQFAYEAAKQRHIPYDFKMNFKDSTALFCSEVASFAYQKMGVQLWAAPSTISSVGVVNWLRSFGVENFVTQMPGDLEYDPQLEVVSEWRDPATLEKDHIDNAVLDALLEKANAGAAIGYSHWQLPMVRCIKAWCMLKNSWGGVGIIPEGMSATQALKNQRLVAVYDWVRAETVRLVQQFRQTRQYWPPYWELLKLARQAANGAAL